MKSVLYEDKTYFVFKGKNTIFVKNNDMNLIERHIQRITDLCRKHKVKNLSVFGSILTERFNEDSDVDLLVNFESFNPDAPEFDYVSNYFCFQDALENLFGRKVDLVEEKGLRNKYLIQNINRSKQQIYG